MYILISLYYELSVWCVDVCKYIYMSVCVCACVYVSVCLELKWHTTTLYSLAKTSVRVGMKLATEGGKERRRERRGREEGGDEGRGDREIER